MFAPLVRTPTITSAGLQRATIVPPRLTQSAVDDEHMLQQSIGDRAVTGRKAALSWDVSKIPVLSPRSMGGVQPLSRFPASSASGLHQANLKISAAGDPLELEADRAADQVMNMPAAPPPPTSLLAAVPAQLSRKCAACEEEEKLQRKPIRAVENSTTEAPSIVHDLLRRPGESLDAPSRAYFEPRFGHDFSQVRIHADEEAAESARSVNAQAYTVGQHVVFGAGFYAPHTGAGSRLLAHELAHVVQQSGGATAPRRTSRCDRDRELRRHARERSLTSAAICAGKRSAQMRNGAWCAGARLYAE